MSIQVEPEKGIIYRLFEEVDTSVPFWRFFDIFHENPYAFFLDSSLAEKRLGTYSFIGSDPFFVYRAFAADVKGTSPGARIEAEHYAVASAFDLKNKQETPVIETYLVDDLFEDLRQVFNRYQLPAWDADPRLPFHAGAVGYLAYEAGSLIEAIPVPDVAGSLNESPLPLAYFLFVDVSLCHCHNTDRTFLSIVGRGNSEAEARALALQRKADLLGAINQVAEKAGPVNGGAGKGPAPNKSRSLNLEAEHDRESYCEAVEQIKAHIREGNAYEVCLTHQFSCAQEKDPWTLYQTLRAINPAPFASFLQLPEAQVVCSSPERFLRLSPDGVIESRPIKGTRPRGESLLHDLKLEDELRTSEKDRAENLMIVDLVRNDLSRVSEIGSVHVPEFLVIETYATVLQLVSTIRGKLKAGLDAFAVIKACFPGGSMTGAPKIEAMKIIASLEKSRRGIYSGAIGYLDFAGQMDLNIVIRSIVIRDGRCYFNVGGAVVSDSDPAAEYQETLDKARALVEALSVS